MARLRSVVLGTPDPRGLAAFYRGLLEDWLVVDDEPDWVKITPPDGGTGLSFQLETGHVAPVWPPREGAQQMQVHLDIAVPDLPAGIARAVELGAVEPPVQPQDDVHVMLDPAGHPFCLFVIPPGREAG